ncbi:MAG TPA: hypothetical protein VKR32_15975 [Puia sp.]|nr:hypothetical protein [Puia sp.]
MKKCCLLVALLLPLCLSRVTAQSYVAFAAGPARDLNNLRIPIYQAPIVFQWKPSPRFAGVIFDVEASMPFDGSSSRVAYTLNPTLPDQLRVRESILPFSWTVGIGFHIRFRHDQKKKNLPGQKKEEAWALEIYPAEIEGQVINVHYSSYDKSNYDILNPDVGTNRGGPEAAIALSHSVSNGFSVMLRARTPPLASLGSYPLSFRFVAPLQVLLRYKLYQKRRK